MYEKVNTNHKPFSWVHEPALLFSVIDDMARWSFHGLSDSTLLNHLCFLIQVSKNPKCISQKKVRTTNGILASHVQERLLLMDDQQQKDDGTPCSSIGIIPVTTLKKTI